MLLLRLVYLLASAILQSYYADAIPVSLKYNSSSHEYIVFWTNKLIKHTEVRLFSLVQNILGHIP